MKLKIILLLITLTSCAFVNEGVSAIRKSDSWLSVPIVDTHVHLPLSNYNIVDEWVEIMKENGVVHGVHLSVHLKRYGNLDLPGFLNQLRHPGYFSVAIGLDLTNFDPQDPDFEKRMKEHIERSSKVGALGIKSHIGQPVMMKWYWSSRDLDYLSQYNKKPPQRPEPGALFPVGMNDPRLTPIFDHAARLRLPKIIHLGWHDKAWEEGQKFSDIRKFPTENYLQAELDWLLRKHRNLTVIAPHMMGDLEEIEKLERMMESHPNLWLDTAVLLQDPLWLDLSETRIEGIRNFFIKYSDRILFGSDAIIYHAGRRIQAIREIGKCYKYYRQWLEGDEIFYINEKPRPGLNLPESVLKKIYYKNAVKIYGDKVLNNGKLPVDKEKIIDHCKYLISIIEDKEIREELKELSAQ